MSDTPRWYGMTDEEFDQIYEESQCHGDRDAIIGYLLKQRKELLADSLRLKEDLAGAEIENAELRRFLAKESDEPGLFETLAGLRARVAELGRDRARLDWLDENMSYKGGGNGGTYSFTTPADVECGMLRAAIDAAKEPKP